MIWALAPEKKRFVPLTFSCPSSLPALVFSWARLSLPQASWLLALPQLLPGLALPAQLSSPPQAEQVQLSALLPFQHVLQQPPGPVQSQSQAHLLRVPLLRRLHFSACVHAS
jgi:hypothetical protein